MLKHIDAGELRERPEILTLTQTDTGWEWTPTRKVWAAAELTHRKNLWSVYGIGATGVSFTLRRQTLELGQALRWKGQHCFITSIVPFGHNHITVEAALVVLSACEDKYNSVMFPGIVTEEYHRHEQADPYATNTLRHVLVTPKCIELVPGRLVEVAGESWHILTAHMLDPNRNEYVIERMVDL